MPAFEVNLVIDQPPEVIEQAFFDPENAVLWTSDLERFEVIAQPEGKVGSMAHLHFKQGGRRYIMKDELLQYTPCEYFKSRVSGNGLDAVVETRLEGLGESTLVKVQWSGTATTLRMRLMLFLMRGAMIRQTQSEFETFKSLVEQHGSHFVQ